LSQYVDFISDNYKYFASGRDVKYRDHHVCMSVHSHISKNTRPGCTWHVTVAVAQSPRFRRWCRVFTQRTCHKGNRVWLWKQTVHSNM